MPIASFESLIDRQGFTVKFRRGTTSYPEVQVVLGRQNHASGVDEVEQEQADYKVTKSALDDVKFPTPPIKGDKIIDEVADKVRNIITSRPIIVNGEVIGYDIKTRG